MFRLKESIRSLVRHTLKRKNFTRNSKTFEILGCSFKEFIRHIKIQFEPWMNWENRGNPKDNILEENKTWDIDHIIPISSAKSEEEIIKLNHYTNLRPFCSFKNRLVKRDSI